MNTYLNMTPRAIWAAWKAQEIDAGTLSAWQDRHRYYFNETGGRILARRLFHRLEPDSFTPGRYLVLNDGCFLAGFYAASDAEAVQRFEKGEYL